MSLQSDDFGTVGKVFTSLRETAETINENLKVMISVNNFFRYCLTDLVVCS